MFNDRDLGILGAGALLAVLCLFLPFSFVGKVVVGFLVLVGFMALALLRLGPDRVPPEVWLTRRFRYSMQTRQYVNQQTATRKTESVQPSQKQKPERPVAEQRAPTIMTNPTTPMIAIEVMRLPPKAIPAVPCKMKYRPPSSATTISNPAINTQASRAMARICCMMGSNIKFFSLSLSTGSEKPGGQWNGSTGDDHAKECLAAFDQRICK